MMMDLDKFFDFQPEIIRIMEGTRFLVGKC